VTTENSFLQGGDEVDIEDVGQQRRSLALSSSRVLAVVGEPSKLFESGAPHGLSLAF